MPRPRFHKLPQTRQRTLLDAARSEFATQGFPAASQNRIIEKAEISKGAFYYYFDDKEDLYVTVMREAAQNMLAHLKPFEFPDDTERFWGALTDYYREITTHFQEHREDIALFRTLTGITSERIQAELQEMIQAGGVWLSRILIHGQGLGAVRTDLALDLMLALVMGAGEAHDYWMLENWDTLEQTEGGLEAHMNRIMGTFRRMLEPQKA